MELPLKGLFVHFEGLTNSVIDAQVHGLVNMLRSADIIDFDIWAFVASADHYQQSLQLQREAEEASQSRITIRRAVRPAVPFSPLMNARRVAAALEEVDIDYHIIHARTDYSACVCSLLPKKLKRWKLVWGCRGDGIAERYPENRHYGLFRSPLKALVSRILRHRRSIAARGCDGAIFVSNELRSIATAGLDVFGMIIPSTASLKEFYFDPALRAQSRSRLRFSDDDIVLIYSGSMTTYQLFPQVVKLFRYLRERHPTLKLLVLTRETKTAEIWLRDLDTDSFHLLSAPHREVNLYLNAADYAVLLREPIQLNAVASPTKFAEYCLTGLPVIMSPSVVDSYAYAQEFGNLCPYRGAQTELTKGNARTEVMKRARELLSREVVIECYRELYTAVMQR